MFRRRLQQSLTACVKVMINAQQLNNVHIHLIVIHIYLLFMCDFM